jgi:hypothetical protein
MRRRMPTRLCARQRTRRAHLRMGRAPREPGTRSLPIPTGVAWWIAVHELLSRLRPGEIVEATVCALDTRGRALLRILGADVWAESAALLTPGERVLLEVESVAPVTVVRLLGGPAEARMRWAAPVVA